jgi:RES domain-containing protein
LTTALAELLAYYQHQGLPETEALPFVLVGFDVLLERVIDLRKKKLLQQLAVTREQLLREPWRELQEEGQEALSQAVGRIAFEAEVEGLLVPSARERGGNNLVVFNPAGLPRGRIRLVKKEQFPTHRR